MEIIPYQPQIVYKRGKELHIADILSRDCSHEPSEEEELSFSVIVIVVLSKERLEEAKQPTLKRTILEGNN